MPSVFDEPTLAEFIEAFEDGIRSTKDRYVDVRDGALFHDWAGVAAILWQREARRDTDLWRAIYLDGAEGNELTNLLFDRYQFDRVPDAYGTGSAVFRRPTVAAGAGAIWAGTRLAIVGENREPRLFVVSERKDVGASETLVTVALRADKAGAGTAVSVGTADGVTLRVEDPLWDTTWTIERMECSDGTSFEPAAAARARHRDARIAARAGFADAIVQACKDAGAQTAVLFPSDFAGDAEDVGLNMAYVGDANFVGSDALVRKVIIALERARVLGDNLQVRPLGRANLVVKADVHLWEAPARLNQEDMQRLLVGATLGYFDGRSSGFAYQRDALAGAMMRAAPLVQAVIFAQPTSDAGIMSTVGGRLNFPASLSRYYVRTEDVTLTLKSPL